MENNMQLEEWRKTNPFFIKKITVKNLVSRYDIEWVLSDINVLVGNNGSGKSTIFKLAKVGLQDINENTNNIDGVLGKFDSFEIELNNGKKGKINIVDDHAQKDQMLKLLTNLLDNEDFIRQMDDVSATNIKSMISSINNDVTSSKNDIRKYVLKGSSQFITKNEEGSSVNILHNHVSIEFISTFDMLLLSQEKYDQYSEKRYSELDVVIQEELERLRSNIIKIKDKTKKEYSKKSNSKPLQEVEDKNNAKLDILNNELSKYFKESDKKVLISKQGNLSITSKEQSLSTTDLSSGEKQLILILIKTLNCSLFNPCIIFMDEPEISLHVGWQMNIINSLKRIAAQSQLVVVTHSPALVMKYYKSKMVDIKDLICK